MSGWIVDGELVDDAPSLQEKACLTSLRVQEGKMIWLEDHLERLRSYCALLGLTMPSISLQLLEQLIAAQRAEQGIWKLRILVFLSKGWRAQLLPYTPLYRSPLSVGLYPFPLLSDSPRLKITPDPVRLKMQQWAQEQGVDDAIATTPEGFLLEGSFANLFWLDNRTLFTPDFDQLPLLEGICLRKVAAHLKELGYEIKKVKATLKEIPSSSALFLCNCLQGCVPIVKCGGYTFTETLFPINIAGLL